MTEHPVTFMLRPSDPAAVAQRYATGRPTQLRNKDAINARLIPRVPEFNRRLNAAVNAKIHGSLRFVALWAIADELVKLAKGNVACRQGCSHCCHLGVAISTPEAELISMRSGRKLNKQAKMMDFTNFDYGYHNPCTFLKDGACSIYEHRPLVCRTQLSVDVDDLLCRLVPRPATVNAVYLNVDVLERAEIAVVMSEPRDVVVSDIREWFPK